MKLATLALTFTVLAAGASYAGGNPDDNEPMGVMTRDPLPQAAPLDTQSIIKDIIEEEIFSEPALDGEQRAEPSEEPSWAHTDDRPFTIARIGQTSECWLPFSWLAKQLGGECFRDSAFHNPGVVGHSTEREVTKEVRVDRKKRSFHKTRKGYRAAKHFARKLHHQGYKVRVGFRKGKIKVVGKKVTTTTFVTLTKVRNDAAGSSGGGTADDSNGMRGDSRDSGNW